MIGTKRRNVSLRSDSEESAMVHVGHCLLMRWKINSEITEMFQSKRISGDSPFQSQGLEASQQQVVGAHSLDLKRAGSSQQHVRALNAQFASWVQSQLQNHPDELWEDGVRDYLTHASNILEKFSDVVSWLKTNTANGGISPSLKAAPIEKQQDKETTTNDETARPGKPIFGATNKFVPSWNSTVLSNSPTPTQNNSPLFSWTSGATTQSQSPSSSANASLETSTNSQAIGQSTPPLFPAWTPGVFSKSPSPSSGTNASGGASSNSQVSAQGTSPNTPPWTSGLFSKNLSPSSGTATSAPAATSWSFGSSLNNQTPFKIENQSTAPLSVGTTNDDADEENEEQPSSPSLKKAEEKGIVVVHEVKCKLYLKASDPADKDPWKDKGTGQLSIKCKEGVSKATKDSKPTILVRNDVGRILLNALLYPGIKTTSVKSNSIMAILHTAADDGNNGNSSDVVARTFLIKTKNEEERNKLAEAIREHAPAA